MNHFLIVFEVQLFFLCEHFLNQFMDFLLRLYAIQEHLASAKSELLTKLTYRPPPK